ncbi:PQQ-binding-like beta-propeller repeat protein [Bacteroidota bacterium]
MIRNLFLSLISLILIGACAEKSEFSDWRGPSRDGIYLETGLLKQWTDDGPDLLWSYEGLGFGHNAVAVANNKVYVTGVRDSIQAAGILFVLDFNGELLWEKEYGKEFTANFLGTRSTPVVVDDLIYIESGAGAVYCLNADNGEEIWSKDFIKDFGVDSVIQFGYAESVLIDGDHLICVPGGRENNVVALNRFTGDKIWASVGQGEQATYNSPIIVESGSQRLVIAMSSGSIMGIDAGTGEMYWRFEHTQRNNIHANTPIYADGKLLVASADPVNTSGMVQIQISGDGKNAEVVWRNTKLRSFMGGIVKIDSCIYGSAYMRNDWQVLGWSTGEMLVQNKDLAGGSIIYADGMFYCYTVSDGEVALVDAAPDKFEIVSKFKVPLGTGQHWAHPVINQGVLYIRHGDVLMAYDIKAD